ncbi:ankyrin repeat domain-containing protein [Legionella bononiensis]|uniref:Ankyrin repeat domain-containing protein n=1 Tax=Legionella bononiensis TaxID=2793102 RepID=A0ABS1W7K1_9GAMM|nr:ankyrin repeat domain-containing protein [Legionella bononiensis]MBL7480166.1 ankyrin repeat domain-containing protein [Legionella bononiensis]MBL7525319.1 ankyrin repeat domain-containing protein [Legionella bononiensis]MBL7561503.1 ankyrin repeat domain-containing protein [Legionella bononiensis]
MFFDANSVIEELLCAIQDINVEHVRSIVLEAKAKRIDLNVHTIRRVTLLHWAILKCLEYTQDDMLLIIKELFEAKIDLNKPSNDKAQYYPLHTASRRTLPKIVQWLLDNGADPSVWDITKKSPIDYVNRAILSKMVILHSDYADSGEMILNRLHEVKRILTHTNQLCSEFTNSTV